MKIRTDALLGVRLKLKRSWEQLNMLKAEIDAFLDERPYQPQIAFNRSSRTLIVKVVVNRSPDPMWSVYIGEILHNFRSALDHIVWELAGRPSPRTHKTQFPIFANEAGFDERGTNQFLKGVNEAVIRLIKSEQPFFVRQDGTIEGTVHSPLWYLKQLSDIDKHRTVHLVGNALSAHHISFPPVAHPFRVVVLHEHAGGPILQNTILWQGILEGAATWPFEEGDIKAEFGVEIAFEEGTPAPGMWGVKGTLIQVGNRAEHVLRRIAVEVFRTEL